MCNNLQNGIKVGKNVKRNISLLAYRKVASSNTSHLEALACFFRFLMKGTLGPEDKKLIS